MNSQKRFYFDYNATAPFAQSVIRWLGEGSFLFANPSSLHASGRQARKTINQVSQYLLEIHGLAETHDIVFHSGATEGINMILRGVSDALASSTGKRPSLIHSPTDHACVGEIGALLSTCGPRSQTFTVDRNGEFSLAEVIEILKREDGSLLNYTYVNNETGVVWPLTWALEIKEKTGRFIHVDSVQAPGRIRDFHKLEKNLDAYSFSGHKFGAMKGVGYSLIKKDLPLVPLIKGGGQQKGRRSGTENAFGVTTLKLAMEELMEKFDYDSLLTSKLWLEGQLRKLLAGKAEIVAEGARNRNANTISLVFREAKTDVVFAALDMKNIEVSSGSACSSGSSSPNRVLKSMGYPDELSRGVIRLSFSPLMNQEEAVTNYQCLEGVLKKFL